MLADEYTEKYFVYQLTRKSDVPGILARFKVMVMRRTSADVMGL
jgi:hypothetical protein